MASPKKLLSNTFALNKQARFDYHILEEFVAGISLSGAEVKSIRSGKASLKDSYAKFDRRGELWLINMHLGQYQPGDQARIEPTRRRKLLLKKTELNKLYGQTKTQGLTLVPLKLFDHHRLVKLEIGLAKGKKKYDKREDLKKKDIKRETQREIKAQSYKV